MGEKYTSGGNQEVERRLEGIGINKMAKMKRVMNLYNDTSATVSELQGG
jgi:hypothetical protein